LRQIFFRTLTLFELHYFILSVLYARARACVYVCRARARVCVCVCAKLLLIDLLSIYILVIVYQYIIICSEKWFILYFIKVY